VKRSLLLIGALLLVAGCASARSQATPDEQASTVPSTVPPAGSTAENTSSTTVTVTPSSSTTTATTTTSTAIPQRERVRTGADRLVEDEFAVLAGRRVGLIVHQNSVVFGEEATPHLADLADEQPDVDLVALFSPEHGVRGTADAGELVTDGIDEQTGVPIYSLFGATRKPTPEMLRDIDVLVYDLQDVGARYYTYISTLGLAMQAASEAGIPFVVLDRPNPLGGTVGGGVMEPGRTSFVGQYPIPAQYGLTSGELADLIMQQQWLAGVDTLDLTVVELDGWDRTMTWEETGLPWIPPSPALTTTDAALLYPAMIYFEALSLSYGRGTDAPFTVFGAPWLDAEAAVEALRARRLDGIDATASEVTPTMLPGMTVEPAYLDVSIPAVSLSVTDASTLRPTEVGVHLLDIVTRQATDIGVAVLARPDWLDQLSGSSVLREAIESGDVDPDRIISAHAQQRVDIVETLAAAERYD